ncbi:MAG: hypothetical protein IJY58_05860 [Alphaproteobacteria bacterium]|nr:hypothetical protein [Alphaproteobacteria bacterium]
MKRFFNCFKYFCITFSSLCVCFSSETQAITMTVDPVGALQEITVKVNRYNKVITENSDLVKATLQAKVNGYTAVVGDMIGSVQQSVSDAYNSATGYVDGKIEAAGNAVMDKASAAKDYISDQFASDDKPGEGFSLSETAKSIKEAYAEYGEYIAPAVQLAQGNYLGAAASIRDSLYTKAVEEDKLSMYTADSAVRNLKKFIQDATAVIVADATQVMNGTSQFKKVQKASEESMKPTNLREDIDTSNGSAVALNVMTNTLLSLDITELSIQSATIYDNINIISGNTSIGPAN